MEDFVSNGLDNLQTAVLSGTGGFRVEGLGFRVEGLGWELHGIRDPDA